MVWVSVSTGLETWEWKCLKEDLNQWKKWICTLVWTSCKLVALRKFRFQSQHHWWQWWHWWWSDDSTENSHCYFRDSRRSSWKHQNPVVRLSIYQVYIQKSPCEHSLWLWAEEQAHMGMWSTCRGQHTQRTHTDNYMHSHTKGSTSNSWIYWGLQGLLGSASSQFAI